MKPVSPTQAWRDLAYILATSAVLIGLNNFQSCGGGESRPTRQSIESVQNSEGMASPGARPVTESRTSDRPARLEPLPRVHLRETPPTLRPVESPELVTL